MSSSTIKGTGTCTTYIAKAIESWQNKVFTVCCVAKQNKMSDALTVIVVWSGPLREFMGQIANYNCGALVYI